MALKTRQGVHAKRSSKSEPPNGRNASRRASCRQPASSKSIAERCKTVTEHTYMSTLLHALWHVDCCYLVLGSEALFQISVATGIHSNILLSLLYMYSCTVCTNHTLVRHNTGATCCVTRDCFDPGCAANIQKLGVGAGIRSCQTAG